MSVPEPPAPDSAAAEPPPHVPRKSPPDVAPESPSEPPAAAGASDAGLARRRRWVVAVVVGAVALSGAGVAASQVIKSPAQAVAEAGPPPMDVLVARVEKRVLRDTVIVRGTATAGQTVRITPVMGGEGAGTPVVTKLPLSAGDRVTAGRVLLEVSGRPVFALAGALPVYRDLKPGATGDDVRQVQKALAARGHGTGSDRAGTFGPGTKAALTAFYASIGYEPLPALADGGASVTAAEEAVTGAERALEDAEAALRTGASPEAGAEAGAGAGKRAAPPGDDGQRTVRRAREDLAKARTRLSEARAAAGPMLPAGEVVFLESFPARVDSVPARIGSQVTGPVMTVSGGALVVHAQLQEHQKGLVGPGQKVQILSEISGVTASADVLTVADSLSLPRVPDPAAGSGTDGQADPPAPAGERGYALVIRPDRPLDPGLAGQDVRLTIEAAATDGEVLVVPVSAVSAGADGRTSVTVVKGQDRRRVEVRPGTAGDGYVEVRPVGSGRLAEGDDVMTGINPGVAEGKEGDAP
ncbi:efflux RND transporter periplasmic adaptor subunit [Streptomyces arboris]|uniref:peptidoglycan-binding protein n=1 Tax=Streptomyces arboris TaxID=2600619 RepID=UPI0036341AA2